MENMLEKCELCPHRCKVNRLKGEVGVCQATDKIKVAHVQLHRYEEPCISGENGSGTVFFSGCNMHCVYCQNYKISQNSVGKPIDINALVNIFLELQNQNAHNINLVTSFMYVPQIIQAIRIARQKGLKIPIVYNSSGYENVETIQALEGYIDVYLPDLKYADSYLGEQLSKVKNYFENATKVIQEMYRQVGAPKLDANGMMIKGVIIRHLVLPNHIENSKKVLKWIKEYIDENVYISVMAQYFPTYQATQLENLNRKLTQKEYKQIEDYVEKLGFLNGYMQDLEENEEQYVPDFQNK